MISLDGLFESMTSQQPMRFRAAFWKRSCVMWYFACRCSKINLCVEHHFCEKSFGKRVEGWAISIDCNMWLFGDFEFAARVFAAAVCSLVATTIAFIKGVWESRACLFRDSSKLKSALFVNLKCGDYSSEHVVLCFRICLVEFDKVETIISVVNQTGNECLWSGTQTRGQSNFCFAITNCIDRYLTS